MPIITIENTIKKSKALCPTIYLTITLNLLFGVNSHKEASYESTEDIYDL